MESGRKRLKRAAAQSDGAVVAENDEIILEDYTEIANRYLERGAREIDQIQIKQALADGATPDLKVEGEPVVRFIRRTFRDRHFTHPNQATYNDWQNFIGSLMQFPVAFRDHELGSDWLFYVIRDLRFELPQNLFLNTVISFVKFEWLDLLLDSNIPRTRKNQIFYEWLPKFLTDSRILKFSTHADLLPVIQEAVQNYPFNAIRYISVLANSYIKFFQANRVTKNNEFIKRKIRQCSTRAFNEGYSGIEIKLKEYLPLLNQTLSTFHSIPFRLWLDFVNVYLYGVKRLNQTSFPFIGDYIIESDVVPVAGHLDRVKFLPLYRGENQVIEAIQVLKERLEQLAVLCQNDPDVRRDTESSFNN